MAIPIEAACYEQDDAEERGKNMTDYAEALRLIRTFRRGDEPIGQMFLRMTRRVEALELVIAEELNPNDCVDDANAMLVEEIHKRIDGVPV